MHDEKTDMVSLAQVLLQLESELAHADLKMEAMETVLQYERLGQVLSPQQMSVLQGFDHVRQILACLEQFLTNLANNTDTEILVNSKAAAKSLALHGLSNRLSNPYNTSVNVSESGDIHLF